jgi:hypothetical protein
MIGCYLRIINILLLLFYFLYLYFYSKKTSNANYEVANKFKKGEKSFLNFEFKEIKSARHLPKQHIIHIIRIKGKKLFPKHGFQRVKVIVTHLSGNYNKKETYFYLKCIRINFINSVTFHLHVIVKRFTPINLMNSFK